jgi:hypothetical protein
LSVAARRAIAASLRTESAGCQSQHQSNAHKGRAEFLHFDFSILKISNVGGDESPVAPAALL